MKVTCINEDCEADFHTAEPGVEEICPECYEEEQAFKQQLSCARSETDVRALVTLARRKAFTKQFFNTYASPAVKRAVRAGRFASARWK